MFCTRCGVEMSDLDRFCSKCGSLASGPASTSNQAPPPPPAASAQLYTPVTHCVVEPQPQLTRSLRNRKIAGVCAGIGRHFGVDPTIVRILFVAMFFCPLLPAIIPYIICWVVMPLERPDPYRQPVYTMPPPMPQQQHQPLASMSR